MTSEKLNSLTELYNFYSGGDEANEADGDEVFELRASTPTTITLPLGRYAWQKQETHKGRGMFDPCGTSRAGWGFGDPMYEHWEVDPSTGFRRVVFRPYYPNATAVNAAPLAQLRDIPVFIHRPQVMFTSPININDFNEILAAGIPALSPAAGNMALDSLPNATQYNSNMNTTLKSDTGAWGRNHKDFGDRWLHSDMKDMAFFYTHKLFEKLATEGELE